MLQVLVASQPTGLGWCQLPIYLYDLYRFTATWFKTKTFSDFPVCLWKKVFKWTMIKLWPSDIYQTFLLLQCCHHLLDHLLLVGLRSVICLLLPWPNVASATQGGKIHNLVQQLQRGMASMGRVAVWRIPWSLQRCHQMIRGPPSKTSWTKCASWRNARACQESPESESDFPMAPPQTITKTYTNNYLLQIENIQIRHIS